MRELLCGVAISALMLSSCVLPYKTQEREMPKTITVHGSGVVTGSADIASINFSVITQEWVAKTASESNAEITRRVYDAVKGAGVSVSDIDTSDINIYRQDTYANGRTLPGRYRVSDNIVVKIRNVDKASAVIDAAVAAGASAMSGLSFSIGDTSSLLREARTKAIQDASETAALLAGASGCKIGDAIMIQEDDVPGIVRQKGEFAMKEAVMLDSAPSTPVSPHEVSVTAGVTVTYLLQ